MISVEASYEPVNVEDSEDRWKREKIKNIVASTEEGALKAAKSACPVDYRLSALRFDRDTVVGE